ELNLDGRTRTLQRLQIGIGNHELDAFNAGVNHPIHRVAAAAANTDNFYPRARDWRLVVDKNIYASAGFAYLRCHEFFLSSKSSEPGRYPRPLSSILGWQNHGASISCEQHIVPLARQHTTLGQKILLLKRLRNLETKCVK